MRVGMHQRTQRSSVDHEPSYKSPKLSRGEDFDFEHGDWMGTNWSVPYLIDGEFGEFIADPGPQLVGEDGLRFVLLWPIREM